MTLANTALSDQQLPNLHGVLCGERNDLQVIEGACGGSPPHSIKLGNVRQSVAGKGRNTWLSKHRPQRRNMFKTNLHFYAMNACKGCHFLTYLRTCFLGLLADMVYVLFLVFLGTHLNPKAQSLGRAPPPYTQSPGRSSIQ